MKKKALIFVGLGVLLTVCLIVALSGSGETPVRVGTQGVMHVSLARFYTLEEAVNESDVVLDVTITAWLGENLGDIRTTFFDADVNTALKGNAPDKITLLQIGNSEVTVDSFPLFQKGNRLIVFLSKLEWTDYEINFNLDYDNQYILLGAHSTVLHVENVQNASYALDRFGMLTTEYFSEQTDSLELSARMSAIDETTRQQFWKKMNASDPLITQLSGPINHIVRYDDYISEIERFAEKEGASE
ncbi:MAG: hypothetical protein LBI19_06075 [Oscillospiraceae bacterium]|jgi:hypothetical protein|nr:hypothetical protein [Oscillospiraceae bacterium]